MLLAATPLLLYVLSGCIPLMQFSYSGFVVSIFLDRVQTCYGSWLVIFLERYFILRQKICFAVVYRRNSVIHPLTCCFCRCCILMPKQHPYIGFCSTTVSFSDFTSEANVVSALRFTHAACALIAFAAAGILVIAALMICRGRNFAPGPTRSIIMREVGLSSELDLHDAAVIYVQASLLLVQGAAAPSMGKIAGLTWTCCFLAFLGLVVWGGGVVDSTWFKNYNSRPDGEAQSTHTHTHTHTHLRTLTGNYYSFGEHVFAISTFPVTLSVSVTPTYGSGFNAAITSFVFTLLLGVYTTFLQCRGIGGPPLSCGRRK